MQKRFLIILIASLGIILSCKSEVKEDTKAEVKTKPNIIFIFADDWGYGDLSCHGSTWIKTPNLDRMASEGIDFTDFTVNSPVCSPSRVAVMTGQFPARNSIHQHFANVKSNHERGMPDWLDSTVPLLPKLLQEVGYITGHFGKWHLGKATGAPTEDAYGYDAFATFNGSGKNNIRPNGLASVDHAEIFIKENKNKPFFINLWLHESHLAHFPQDRYMEEFNNLDEQKQVYASIIAEGDEGVGRILKLLEELKLDDNTLVVFSSDNGPEATRGIEHKKHNGKNYGGYYSVGETAGLIGQKRSLYAGGTRVPFIVKWPGVTPKGIKDTTSVITAVDLLPTFLDIAGVKMPENFAPDGENVIAAFKGEGFKREKVIYWEWKGGISKDYTWPSIGLRDGDWKLITNKELNKTELYNIKNDWAEKRDVSVKNPDIVKELEEKLGTWKKSLPTSPKESCISKMSK
jgi:N-acetylgalactosamine-6-sulfatase